MERNQIKQVVTDHYAARARAAASSVAEPDTIPLVSLNDDEACCGPSEMTEEELRYVRGLYSETEVAGLPEGAIDAAAGCGNPTAIAEVSAGEVILDLGSGGGIDCFLAARQTGPTGRVIGVDMTPEMVELAKRNATELGASNVEFRFGEIEDLPVDDATVDLIISNCVVNLSTDKQAVFAEAYRVLKPGGRFRVSDMVWRAERPEGADSVEEWAGCIAGALPLADFLAGLTSAGFVKARADALRELPRYEGLASALISAEKP
jgi:ubiquinone/menaquinone biosynthesis C-methylase UbiE